MALWLSVLRLNHSYGEVLAYIIVYLGDSALESYSACSSPCLGFQMIYSQICPCGDDCCCCSCVPVKSYCSHARSGHAQSGQRWFKSRTTVCISDPGSVLLSQHSMFCYNFTFQWVLQVSQSHVWFLARLSPVGFSDSVSVLVGWMVGVILTGHLNRNFPSPKTIDLGECTTVPH